MIDRKRRAGFAARIIAAGAIGVLAWSANVRAQIAPAPGQPLPAQPVPTQALPAQPSPDAPAEPPVPQYQVEVMIFAHRDFDRSEELFENEPLEIPAPGELRAPPAFDDTTFGFPVQDPNALLDPAAPQNQNASQNPVDTRNPAAPPSLEPGAGENAPLGGRADGSLDPAASELAPLGADPLAAADGTEFRFRLLRPEELQLTNQYRVIERNAQAYVPLLHGGWVQPGLPDNEARPFDLTMLGATNPVGSIRLYLSRFLHVNLDLSYLDTATATAAATAPAPFEQELAEVPVTPRYRLEADRTARSGELHYFDHPAFGVLIKITPVRLEPTPAGTPGTRPAA